MANDRITALEEALEFYADQSAWTQPPVKTRDGILSVEYENQASKMQRDRGDIARAALAASRAAPDCHQPDLVTAAQVRTAWWCDACRSVGMVHCSDPEHCGFMRTCGQEADEWKSWLDDLPLHEDFSTGIDRLQDFISRIVAALDLTPAPAVEPVVMTAQDAARVPETDAERFDRADWFWRTADPDDNGYTPHEVVSSSMLGDFCVCEIASSYAGPTRYGFTAPVLDPESDDDEFLHFATQQEAIDAAKERATAIRAIVGDA